MCLILQETLFQDQVLKSCKSVQARQLASIETCRIVQARGLTAA